ncbi:hypothetical protein JKP88DRAFT_279655 [Tribonema minus]|uniref:Uncharacterized protein n=1 Tax=Tribonema minus TaxID=303371 RepID=A0A835YRT4_9STRA|nr:hypothetical protein JKP88DRAFT_279655 [Tribonema minus]
MALSSLPESFGNLTALTSLSLAGCWELSSLPPLFGNLTADVEIKMYGLDRIDESLASNVDSTLNAVLVTAALLATLGYSSLANPTDWDDSLGNTPADPVHHVSEVVGADTLQTHGDSPERWLAAYLILSQVSFYGSITSIAWCLTSVLLNANAYRMIKRGGGDRKRVMLAAATLFLIVAIVAILAAYFCVGMTCGSARGGADGGEGASGSSKGMGDAGSDCEQELRSRVW